MLVGFEVTARPRRARDYEADEESAQQVPMRPERRGEQRRAPSTDQKKIRHQQQRKTAEQDRERDPWLITYDEHGNTKKYDEPDDESLDIANSIMGDHARHGGVFFVPECPQCVAEYGSKGERWGQHHGSQDIELSRRVAAVSYATTIDDVLRSTDV